MNRLISLAFIGLLIVSCGKPRDQVNPLEHPKSAKIGTLVGLSDSLAKQWAEQKINKTVNCVAMVVPTQTPDNYLVGVRSPCPQNNIFTNIDNAAFKLKLGLSQVVFSNKTYTVYELLYKDKHVVGYLSLEESPITSDKIYTLETLCNTPTQKEAICNLTNDGSSGHLTGVKEIALEKGLSTSSSLDQRKAGMASILAEKIKRKQP